MSKEEKKVEQVFTKEELAVMFNAIGELPIKLNSPECDIFGKLRIKIKDLHDKIDKLN